MTRSIETQRDQYRRVRHALGWSVADAARALGVSELEMARLERSEEFRHCYRLARFYAEALQAVEYVPTRLP